MRTLFAALIPLVLLTLFSSCTMERRHYRNGYYLNWSSKEYAAEAVAPDTTVSKVTEPDSSVHPLLSREENADVKSIAPVDTATENSFLNEFPQANGDSAANLSCRKGEQLKKEDVYKYKHLSMIGLGIGVCGVGISIAAVYMFSFALFILGFLAVGCSLIIAGYVLFGITRLTHKFPELRWPSGKRNFDSPYANGQSTEDDLLWSMRKSRLWAIIISWFTLVVYTTLLMFSFAI